MMFLCMENMEMLPPLYAMYVARFELGESRIAILTFTNSLFSQLKNRYS